MAIPQVSLSLLRSNRSMTHPRRIYQHSSAPQWFGQPELAGYQLFAVNRDEESAWEIYDAYYVRTKPAAK